MLGRELRLSAKDAEIRLGFCALVFSKRDEFSYFCLNSILNRGEGSLPPH